MKYLFIMNGDFMAKDMAKITIEPGKQEILIEREFDAPRELVFKALNDPELYA